MASEATPSAPAGLGLRLRLLLTVCPAVYILDQVSKLAVRRLMEPYGSTVEIIPQIARLRFIFNQGIAFGLSLGVSRWVLVAITAAVALFILWYILGSSYSDRPGLFALCLIAGGALGNLHDRLFNGRVVDFIEIGWRDLTWPVFNVADIALTVGAILLALRLLREGAHEKCSGRDTQPD
ncbi:signal peptidase II [bacterium]|nr:signal peptidase II [bacterium]